MKSKTGSKKKVLIAAILAGVLMIGAIVSVVLVLAAQTQNITSNIKISYTVDGVGARVSAKYGTVKPDGTVDMLDMTTSDGVNKELTFNVNDSTTTESLTPNGDITLSQATGTEVVFEYRFQNTADTKFTIGFKSTGEEEDNYNIKERYYISKKPLNANEYARIVEEDLAKQVIANYDDIMYIYVKVSVDNVNRSARYEKAYNWQLNQINDAAVTVTLDNTTNGGTGGLTSVSAYAEAAVPMIKADSLPTAPDGMAFEGYYSDVTAGDLYISANGIGIKEIAGAMTLYARYSEAAVIDVVGTVMYGINPTANTTEVTVPNQVTEISDGAFEGNDKITNVTIGGETAQTVSYATGSALRKIGANAFKNCINLINVLFADKISLISIGKDAFNGCSSIEELVIPEGVTSVGENAFANCSNIKKLVLPTSLTSAPIGVLKGCTKLEEIILNAEIIPEGNNYAMGVDAGFAGLYGQYDYDPGWGDGTIWKMNDNSLVPTSLSKVGLTGSSLAGGAFIQLSQIKTLTFYSTLSLGVGVNGGHSFMFCNGIEEIIYADGCEEAFMLDFYIQEWQNDLANLKKITIADSVKSVNLYDLFTPMDEYSYALSTDFLNEYNGGYYLGNENNPYLALIKCGDMTQSTFEFHSDTKIIGNKAFYNNTTLTNITLPSDLTSIGDYLFYGCTGLTSIEIPNSVTSIGSYAFYGCTNLGNIEMSNSVTEIGRDAFSGCLSLINIVIPASVTKIDNYAFSNCISLESIEVDKGNKVYTSANGSNSIIKIADNRLVVGCKNTIIPDSVKIIGTGAFYKCTSLKSIDIPDSVTNLEYGAFYECSGLSNINFSDGITIIGGSAFYKCTGLKSITIPNSVIEIGSSAFYGCSGLKSITIPSSVSKIGTRAFYECVALTEINYNAKKITNLSTSNAAYIFYKAGFGTSGVILNIGADVEEIPQMLFYGSSSAYSKITDINFAENGKIKIIKAHAFAYCKALKSINIPNTVTDIEDYAFYECTGLTSITLPSSIVNLGNSVFYNCTGLKEINYNIKKLTNTITTSSYMFYKAGSSSGGLKFIIGEEVEEIPANLFYYSVNSYKANITSVVVPTGSKWIYSTTKGATTGTSITITASNLKSYCSYYIIRTDK